MQPQIQAEQVQLNGEQQQQYQFPNPYPQMDNVPVQVGQQMPYGGYQQPPPNYQPTQQQQPYMYNAQQPIIVQPIVIQQTPIRINADGCTFPADIQCPYCQKKVQTVVHKRNGSGTWCASILLMFFFFPLFWLPFCFEDCKNKIHTCPQCGKMVGKKKYHLC